LLTYLPERLAASKGMKELAISEEILVDKCLGECVFQIQISPSRELSSILGHTYLAFWTSLRTSGSVAMGDVITANLSSQRWQSSVAEFSLAHHWWLTAVTSHSRPGGPAQAKDTPCPELHVLRSNCRMHQLTPLRQLINTSFHTRTND